MGMSTGGGGPSSNYSAPSVSSDINVTPLVDVMLVLLIIFMVVTPALLQGFQATSRSNASTQAWVEAVSAAEAAMEETKLGAPPTGDARVDVQPWPGAPEVELVTVTVALPDGGSFVLRRLVTVR